MRDQSWLQSLFLVFVFWWNTSERVGAGNFWNYDMRAFSLLVECSRLAFLLLLGILESDDGRKEGNWITWKMKKSTIHVFHFSSLGITAYFARTEQMEA